MLKFIKTSRLSSILLAVIILLIFLHYLGILKPIENLAVKILAPIQHQVYSLGTKINNIYANLSINKDLAAENKKLAEEVRQLTITSAQLKTQLAESQALVSQQDFLVSTGLQAVTAKVIGKSPEAARQAIIINIGSNDGLKIDFPLITADGVIVGKISQVKKNSAEAILVNDSTSRIAALVQNEAKSKGVVVGEHGLSLKMELIPQNEVVTEGDVVITSGLEPTIPRGLVIGKISRVLSEPNSFFQIVWLQSLVKIDSLIVVSVLTSREDDE